MSSTKKNYIYQICYQILISILPFITSPYISRVLGAECIGIYSYTYSIVIYFKIFAALGIGNYGNRVIAKVKDDREELNKTFSSLFILHTILSMTVIIIYLIYWNEFVKENKVIVLIQVIYLVSELLDVNWFYFGMEKFKLTVTKNSIIKIITVIAVFLFVHQPEDLWKYVLIMALGNLLATSSVIILLPKFVKFVKFPIMDSIQHLKPMLVLFFAVIATSIYSYMDKIMIGVFSTHTELGYYENAWKMIEFPVGFITALGTVMLPKISNLITKGDKEIIDQYIYRSMRFSMIAAVAIAFGVAGIAQEFAIVFWGSEFAKSGILMMVMTVTIVLMAWNAVIRNQYLIPNEYDKIYLFAVSGGAIVNFIVNWLLIPQFGSLGAGVGTVMAYASICIIQTWYATKELSVFKYFIQSVPYIIIGLIMFFVVRIVGNSMGCSVATLFVEVIVGVTVFGVFALVYAVVFKDVFVIKQVEQLKKMLLRK